jgi:hypothetical protein
MGGGNFFQEKSFALMDWTTFWEIFSQTHLVTLFSQIKTLLG